MAVAGTTRRSGWALCAAWALALAGAACSSEATLVAVGDEEVIEEVTFAPSLNIDLASMTRLPSGVYIKDLAVGSPEGEALALGMRADVHFTGWLRTGVQFTQGDHSFLMGNSEVILGFEQGLMGMRKGGTRLMIIPPALAWGAQGASSVPPGAIVIFEADLTSVNP